jgi:hypothetical protein
MLAAFVLLTTAVETTAGASRASAPGAPTTPSATPGNARATVKWTAPPGNGSAIVAYVITPYIGTTARASLTFRSKATTEIVTGLKNGTAYTFRIAAKNAKGTGHHSAPSNTVRVGVPAAPAVRSAMAGNARATVSWAAPANNGSAIVAYVITPYVGAVPHAPITFNSNKTTETVTGLSNGTTYTFCVAAKNARGTGRRSRSTNAVKLGVPDAPTAPTAAAGNRQATLTWTAAAGNGAPIAAYVVTPYVGTTAQSPVTFQSAATTDTVTGLTSGTTYTFRVAAENAFGLGPGSAPTNAVALPVAIAFGKSALQGTSSTYPTVMRFGPDGRLYVGEMDGLIKAYTVARNAASNTYAVTNTETISLIQQIPNHDDNGALNPMVTTRLITGLAVVGTAGAPVVYVSSSDPRVGEAGSETSLDTNSGMISRLTRDANGWHRLDLVRGLPRSEENHATNALALDPATNTLYVAQGGNTNMGAPSLNFGDLPEYAYSGAILKVDLNAIGDTTYDLPTLVDDNLPTLVGPFGGDFGRHQAKITPSSPVQVFAPGFRNPFSLVRTRAGQLYAWDNGSNAGWGDVPVGAGPGGHCTNAIAEPGIDLNDSLHHISAGYYAGHPNPTRGNMANTFNTTNPQSPVPAANPVECEMRTPATNGSISNLPTPTTGMAEYTANNLGDQLDGDLITAGYYGDVYRTHLGAGGVNTSVLFSNVGQLPIDVTVQGTGDAYPGTIWVADLVDGSIDVFEPADFGGRTATSCTGSYNANLDEDGDGYTNADEIDNGTDPCSAADEPHDWNRNFVSDRNDPNDDSDTVADVSDPFAIDASNGLNTHLPISYSWKNGASGNPCAPTPFRSGCPGGLLGLGFTGLMTDGHTSYDRLYDTNNMTAGGAAGVLTVSKVPAGDATGPTNTQQYAFQFGVNANPTYTGVFTAHTRIEAPFGGLTPQGNQSMGFYIGTGDQDNYAKVVLTANGGNPGVQFVEEVNGVPTAAPVVPLALPGPDSVDLYLTVDPTAATVAVSYRVTSNGSSGPLIALGMHAIPPSWCSNLTSGLAIGVIATSAGAPTFPATWSVLEATWGSPPN